MDFYLFGSNEHIDMTNPSEQFISEFCDVEKVDPQYGESEKCPLCGRAVSNKEWLEPRKIRLSNTRYADHLYYWFCNYPFVVSERFVEVYKESNLSGIKEFLPLEVVKVSRMRKNSPKPPRYFIATIPFTKNVTIDVDKTIVVGKDRDWKCELCSPFGKVRDHFEKLTLNTTNWSGEDIFEVYNLGIVASQRFKDFVEENNFTNFEFIKIADYKKA